MTDTPETTRNLIAVGGPLHGHVVTVREGVKRIVALITNARVESLPPRDTVIAATHTTSGVQILEERRDGDAFVTYEIYRRHGFLCLFADVDSLGNDVARDKALIAALAIYAGLSQGANI